MGDNREEVAIIPYRELTDNDNIIMNSGTIHISNTITLKQKQAWLYMVYRAFPNIGKQRIFRMYQTDLIKAINYSSGNKEHLRHILRELAECKVEFNILNKDGSGRWLITHLLASCEIIENQGIIEYEFSEKLEEKLINPVMYAKLNLLVSKMFKSKHALNIYMLAMDYIFHKINVGEKILSVDELKLYLGLMRKKGNDTIDEKEDKEYKYRVVDIHRHILKKAEKEINKISDINLTITPVKQANRITAFRFKMFVKDDYVANYQKTFGMATAEKQISLFEQAEQSKEIKETKRNITFKDEALRKFFAKHNTSTTTETFQDKLREVKEMFGSEKMESYLLFLTKYAESEFIKGSIANMSGFFVSLLKDGSQIDNYLFEQEQEQKKVETKKIRIESLLESKIKERYESSMSNGFEDYLEKNIELIEPKFIEIVNTHIIKSFARDYLINKQNKGVVDKTLILNHKKHIRMSLITDLKPFQKELGYIKPTFDEWKAKTINDEYLEELRLEIEKNL